MKKVVKSATIARISHWIESLSLGYNTEIGGDGHKDVFRKNCNCCRTSIKYNNECGSNNKQESV